MTELIFLMIGLIIGLQVLWFIPDDRDEPKRISEL